MELSEKLPDLIQSQVFSDMQPRLSKYLQQMKDTLESRQA
jgi:hypothetical protein